jgi:hypothetical protein
MSTVSRSTLALVVAAASASAAHAATDAGVPLSARQIEHRGQMLAKHPPQRTKGEVAPLYNLDAKPPELKRFVLGQSPVVISTGQSGSLVVELFATDNLVGVQSAEVTVRSADGQYSRSDFRSVSFPRGRATLSVPLTFWADSVSGEWLLSSVTLTDANDNARFYDAAALAALGNTSFQVVNRVRTDGIEPEFTGGAILTRTVSRGAPPRGEFPHSLARVGVSLTATDSGVSKISGLSRGYATLCMEGGWPCIYVAGEAERLGKAAGTLVLGNVVSRDAAVGRYTVESVELMDVQGNTRYLYSWDVDFNALFGGDASITITE